MTTLAALEFIFLKKDNETGMTKHLAAIGFAVFYTVYLLTSTDNLVFAFAISMIFGVPIFNDVRDLLKINIGTITVSTLNVVLGDVKGGFGYRGMKQTEDFSKNILKL